MASSPSREAQHFLEGRYGGRVRALEPLVDAPERRIHGWRAALEASPTGARALDLGVAALAELVHDPAFEVERHVVHSDLLYRNVLVADGRLTGIFDWANSLYGDHLY